MTKPTIGFIGAGHIGSQVARLAVSRGYPVVMSNSRGPGTLAALVAELGSEARAATSLEAILLDWPRHPSEAKKSPLVADSHRPRARLSIRTARRRAALLGWTLCRQEVTRYRTNRSVPRDDDS